MITKWYKITTNDEKSPHKGTKPPQKQAKLTQKTKNDHKEVNPAQKCLKITTKRC